ncbi:hypothetical protein BC831DRAFT_446548 [Entophlyctis helioformis]|nr:hypothetical protein BC831DRAFT_446548 [Entophlyctis helioformis]
MPSGHQQVGHAANLLRTLSRGFNCSRSACGMPALSSLVLSSRNFSSLTRMRLCHRRTMSTNGLMARRLSIVSWTLISRTSMTLATRTSSRALALSQKRSSCPVSSRFARTLPRGPCTVQVSIMAAASTLALAIVCDWSREQDSSASCLKRLRRASCPTASHQHQQHQQCQRPMSCLRCLSPVSWVARHPRPASCGTSRLS